MNWIKLRRKIPRRIAKHKIFAGILLASSVLAAVWLILIVFGLDQRILKTEFAGKVVSTTGEPIEAAEIQVQNQKAQTDTNGEFSFEDVNFGFYEVRVTKNGFNSYSEKINFARFYNNKTFVISNQEFGNVKLILEYPEEFPEDVSVTINSQSFPIQNQDDKYFVDTGRLLTGNYSLAITSAGIKNIQTRLEIEPGSFEKILELSPGADVVAEFVDYLTEKNITGLELKFFVDGKERGLTTEEVANNRLSIFDIDVSKDLRLQIKRPGYLDKNVDFSATAGVNSLDKIKLIPADKVLTTSASGVYSAHVDGSNVKRIYENGGNCETVSVKANYHVFRCGEKLLLFLNEDGEFKLSREYQGFEKFDVLAVSANLVALSQDGREILEIFSVVNQKTIFEYDRQIESIITDTNNNIFFSDKNGVYRLDRGNNRAVSVISGEYYLQDLSPDGNNILALSKESSPSNNIWIININNKSSSKLSFLPGDYRKLEFINDQEYYFLKNASSLQLFSSRSGGVEKLVVGNIKNYSINPQNGRVLIFDNDGGRIFVHGEEMIKPLLGNT